ncbi:MAG: hypothetical protein EXS37_20470 [Opitutus sp.]|nr:hypothetical protein [Opitutus sp.]
MYYEKHDGESRRATAQPLEVKIDAETAETVRALSVRLGCQPGETAQALVSIVLESWLQTIHETDAEEFIQRLREIIWDPQVGFLDAWAEWAAQVREQEVGS